MAGNNKQKAMVGRMPRRRKKARGKTPGQAVALSRPKWDEWIQVVAAECGPHIAVVLSLTANFGLRCSEAL